MFNKNLFKAKLVEHGYSVKDVADMLGCNQATLYRKINGTSDFDRNDIQLIKLTFNLSPEEVNNIFFAS